MNFVVHVIGSDIGGSIRMPAFFCGVFGHKPSKFVVSNEGQYPAPFTTEQGAMLGIGPICRYLSHLTLTNLPNKIKLLSFKICN